MLRRKVRPLPIALRLHGLLSAGTATATSGLQMTARNCCEPGLRGLGGTGKHPELRRATRQAAAAAPELPAAGKGEPSPAGSVWGLAVGVVAPEVFLSPGAVAQPSQGCAGLFDRPPWVLRGAKGCVGAQPHAIRRGKLHSVSARLVVFHHVILSSLTSLLSALLLSFPLSSHFHLLRDCATVILSLTGAGFLQKAADL